MPRSSVELSEGCRPAGSSARWPTSVTRRIASCSRPAATCGSARRTAWASSSRGGPSTHVGPRTLACAAASRGPTSRFCTRSSSRPLQITGASRPRRMRSSSTGCGRERLSIPRSGSSRRSPAPRRGRHVSREPTRQARSGLGRQPGCPSRVPRARPRDRAPRARLRRALQEGVPPGRAGRRRREHDGRRPPVRARRDVSRRALGHVGAAALSVLRARCPQCRTLTAVAFEDDYECTSCGASFAAGLVRVPRAWGDGGEAMADAALTELPYPEALVVDMPTLDEQSATIAKGLPRRPLVLGGAVAPTSGRSAVSPRGTDASRSSGSTATATSIPPKRRRPGTSGGCRCASRSTRAA